MAKRRIPNVIASICNLSQLFPTRLDLRSVREGDKFARAFKIRVVKFVFFSAREWHFRVDRVILLFGIWVFVLGIVGFWFGFCVSFLCVVLLFLCVLGLFWCDFSRGVRLVCNIVRNGAPR